MKKTNQHPKPRAVFCISSNKLITIDTIIPVMMKLKKEIPEAQFFFMVNELKGVQQIEKNYVIREGVHQTGQVVSIQKDMRSRLVRRILSGLHLLYFIVRALLVRTWVFTYHDMAPFPYSLLQAAVRVRGGKVVYFHKQRHGVSPMRKAMPTVLTWMRPHGYTPLKSKPDAAICFNHSHAEAFEKNVGAPVSVLGHPHNYSVWREHLASLVSSMGVVDVHGKSIQVEKSKTMVVFYSGDVPVPSQTRDQVSALESILRVLSEEASDFLILLKPHPNAEVTQIEGMCEPHPNLDVRITYAHPQILCNCSSLAIFNSGSGVMDDAYLEDLPVAETSVYLESLLKFGRTPFPNKSWCDASTEEKLRDIIRRLKQDPSQFASSVTDDIAPEVSSVLDAIEFAR